MILKSDNRKNIVLGAVATLGIIWIFISLVLVPLNERKKLLQIKISTADAQLMEIMDLADRYMELSALAPMKSGKAASKASQPISAEVDRIARSIGIQKKIKRMSPIASFSRDERDGLSLTVTDLKFSTLVDFFQRLHESPVAIHLSRAKIKAKYDKRNLLEAEMTLAAGF